MTKIPTRTEIPTRIVRSATVRTDKVVGSIKKAMADMESEIREADGLYPQNGGRLSMAEVCRRAEVHPITMMGKAHRDTTRPMILAWIKKMTAKSVNGAQEVRKKVTERADNWEAQFKAIATQFKAMYSVEIPRRENEIERLRTEVTELKAKLLQLRTDSSRRKALHRPPTKKQKR